MYNKCVFVGNLTRDIELRYMPSGAALAKSALATSHKFKGQDGQQKDEVCFLDFNIFGRSAEVANQYLRKGSKVLLEGRLVFEQWTAQDGTNRSKHALRVDTMKMLDTKSDSSNQAGEQYNPNRGNGAYGGHAYNDDRSYKESYDPNPKSGTGQNAPVHYENSQGQEIDHKEYRRQEQETPEINMDEEIPF